MNLKVEKINKKIEELRTEGQLIVFYQLRIWIWVKSHRIPDPDPDCSKIPYPDMKHCSTDTPFSEKIRLLTNYFQNFGGRENNNWPNMAKIRRLTKKNE